MNKINYKPSVLTKHLSAAKQALKTEVFERFKIPRKVKSIQSKKEKLKEYFEKKSEFAFKDELEKIAKKSSMEILKNNRMSLTSEERQKAISGKATWDHNRATGQATPTVGIWKSKDSSGKIKYCSNTHRAMSSKDTLSQAIKAFKFIRSTS